MREFPREEIREILIHLSENWPEQLRLAENPHAAREEMVLDVLGRINDLWRDRRKGERRQSQKHHHAVLQSDLMEQESTYLFSVDSGTSLLPVYTTDRRKLTDRRKPTK